MQWTKEKGQTIIYKISFYPDKTLSRKISATRTPQTNNKNNGDVRERISYAFLD
jgi:hypothetical protein